MSTGDRDRTVETRDLTELPEPAQLPIDNDFWELFKNLVALVYNTDPGARLDTVVPFLRDRYGRINSSLYKRIENHILRVVAFMERMERFREGEDIPPNAWE